MALIDVVIPCRPGDVPTDTMQSLMAGTVKDLRFIVQVDHEGRGQSWARNRGAELVTAPYVLFSDYDIFWKHKTVEWMKARLDVAMAREETDTPRQDWTAFTFCRFQWVKEKEGVEVAGQKTYKIHLELATEEWDVGRLRHGPYISPMSLWSTAVWREQGLHFDESLRRLEDWDLMLTAAEKGLRGEWLSEVGFQTVVKPGISWESQEEFAEARQQVLRKHGLA